MIISIIAAMDKNRLIGHGNRLPWKLPADMKHFRQLTLGKPVVMGRRTFDSIGKPLAKRSNVILTRDHNYRADGCAGVAHDEFYEVSAVVLRQRHPKGLAEQGGGKGERAGLGGDLRSIRRPGKAGVCGGRFHRRARSLLGWYGPFQPPGATGAIPSANRRKWRCQGRSTVPHYRSSLLKLLLLYQGPDT